MPNLTLTNIATTLAALGIEAKLGFFFVAARRLVPYFVRMEVDLPETNVDTHIRTEVASQFWKEIALASMGVVGTILKLHHMKWALAPFVGFVLVSMIALFLVGRKRRSRATIRGTPEGIRVGDTLLARRSIRTAYLLREPSRLAVDQAPWRRSHEIEMTPDDAKRVLAAAELDPTRMVTRIPIGPYMIRLLLVVAAAATAAMGALFYAVNVPDTFFYYFLALPLCFCMVRGRAEIAKDGLLLRWLMFRRFIPADSIGKIEAIPKDSAVPGVRLTLRGGGSVVIASAPNSPAPEELAKSFEAALGSKRDLQTMEEILLAERGRGAPGWVAELRRLARSEGTFRTASVVPERLWEVLENGAAQLGARAAAAVALAPTLDEAGRARLRVVTETVASPKLRVALESCLDANDDDTAARALERIG